MTIELTPQTEIALAEEAIRRGTTPDLLAVELITAQLPPTREKAAAVSSSDCMTKESSGETMYDLWKAHFDSLPKPPPDAPPTNYAQDTGRRFAEAMVEKQRQGHL